MYLTSHLLSSMRNNTTLSERHTSFHPEGQIQMVVTLTPTHIEGPIIATTILIQVAPSTLKHLVTQMQVACPMVRDEVDSPFPSREPPSHCKSDTFFSLLPSSPLSKMFNASQMLSPNANFLSSPSSPSSSVLSISLLLSPFALIAFKFASKSASC